MLLGPKYKICKRLGSAVFEKCQTQRFQLAEARSPRKQSRKRGGNSDYGAQLLEKQKARFQYGLSEKQFSRYAHEAMEGVGSSATALIGRLEARLDNAVYRAGLTKTRRAARQLVSHGHLTVNGRRVNIPSYHLEVGDVVAVRPESRGSALFINRAETAVETRTPEWMKMDADGFSFDTVKIPISTETELPWSASTIIQFYSR